MLLHRLYLDPRCKEARRDLADAYEMHSTLCRAFSEPEHKSPVGEFLWRLDPETSPEGYPRVIVQSRSLPNWQRIGIERYFAHVPDPPIELAAKLHLDSLSEGARFRFRLRANPCVTRDGRRIGLLKREEQEAWLERKGKEQAGFKIARTTSFDFSDEDDPPLNLHISQETMLHGKRRSSDTLSLFSTLYDGELEVLDTCMFRKAIEAGIGHGKAFGLGLLSVAPLT